MNLQLQTTVYTDGTRQTTRQSIPFAADEGREHELINLYPDVTYQKFRGFGGAVTDSAAYMYAQLNTEQKKAPAGHLFQKGRDGLPLCAHLDRQLRFLAGALRGRRRRERR